MEQNTVPVKQKGASHQSQQKMQESMKIDRQVKNGIFKSIDPIDDEFYIDREQPLARGTRGIVYKGIYKKINKYIAIKLKHESRYQQEIRDNYMESIRQQELKLLYDLAKVLHQNIMQFYGHKVSKDVIYYFMELCEGGTLQQYIANTVKVNQLKVAEIFQQILQVMVYLNSQNIFHRYLNPSNIFLDKENNVKLSGFGFTKWQPPFWCIDTGTPLYQAPEVFFRKNVHDARCAVWSAGLILYELLTGKQYFYNIRNKKQLKNAMTAMEYNNAIKVQYPANLDSDWQALIKLMLVFDEKQRPYFKDIHQKYLQIKPALLQRLKNKGISS